MKFSKGVLVAMGLAWLGVVPIGFLLLGKEEFTPVATVPSVVQFPRQSQVKLAVDKPTLVLFFHPYCPCSRASLSELDRILAETDNKISTTVVFTVAKGEPAGWDQADLWKSATAMPGVVVVRDEGGGEAHDFGVTGSGHALLYSPSGHLLFSGGITGSRGHEGDNAGQAAIVSLVLHGSSPITHAPVFGCSLL
jgi:thiol-disulfide isomerase/thioredoxin